MKVLTDDEALLVIAANVKRLRNGTSYRELARRAGIYPAQIERVEKGRHMPGAAMLLRIAAVLGTTPDGLLTPPRRKKTT